MANPANPQTRMIGIVCLVDASLVLASEWDLVWTVYILNIIKRLYDAAANPPVGVQTAKASFYVALVAYGTADARPSPLIACRYFDLPQTISNDLREHTLHFGFGGSLSGGKRGMAALEGYAAALELFDSLREDGERSESLESYLIHVAAHPPDGSKHPFWNVSPELDSLSWETLPQEVHKRDVKLSMILLRPLQDLSNFYGKVVAVPQAPWFPLRKTLHAVLLSGIPIPDSPPIKRAAETAVPSDASPDSKRARTGPNAALPNQQSDVTTPQAGAPAPKPSVSAKSTAQPSAAISRPAPLSAIQANNLTFDAFRGRMLTAAAGLLQEKTALEAINPPTVQSMTKIAEVRKKAHAIGPLLQTCIASFMGSAKALQDSGQVSATAVQAFTEEIKYLMQDCTRTILALQQQGTKLPGNQMPTSLANAAASQLSSSTQVSPLPPTVPSPVQPGGASPAHMTAQFHKLMQARQLGFTTPASNPTSVAPAGQPPANQWRGVLSWAGHDSSTNTLSPKICGAMLIGRADLHAATWPQFLQILPSRYTEVSTPVLKAWMERTKPVLCQILPTDQGADVQTNTDHLSNLTTMLSTKHIYAVASWTRSTGVTSENLLLVAISPRQLIGIAFPLTGIVDFPAAPTNTPSTAFPLSISPQPPIAQSSQSQVAMSQPSAQTQNNVATSGMLRGVNMPNEIFAEIKNNRIEFERFQNLSREDQQRDLLARYQQKFRQAQQAQAQKSRVTSALGNSNMPFSIANVNPPGNVQNLQAFFNQTQLPSQQQSMAVNAMNMNAAMNLNNMNNMNMGGMSINSMNMNQGGMGGMGGVSPEVMQSFMQRNQNGAGGSGQQ